MSNQRHFKLSDREPPFWKPTCVNGLTDAFEHLNAIKHRFDHLQRNEDYERKKTSHVKTLKPVPLEN